MKLPANFHPILLTIFLNVVFLNGSELMILENLPADQLSFQPIENFQQNNNISQFIASLNELAVPERRRGEIRDKKYFYFIKEKKDGKFSMSNAFLTQPNGTYFPNTHLIRDQYRGANGKYRTWLMGPFVDQDKAEEQKEMILDLAESLEIDATDVHLFYYMSAVAVPLTTKKKHVKSLPINSLKEE